MDPNYADYLIEKTKKDYNQFAEKFSNTREENWPEIWFFRDFVKPEEKVLDNGCGSGRLYKLFTGKEIEYFGVDFSGKMIDIAREKFLSSEESRKEPNQPVFLTVNSLKLPFEDNFFDKVFSVAVLHHIPSEEKRIQFLKEVRRVLKKGGELFLTVWNLWQPRYFPHIFKRSLLKTLGLSKLDYFDIFIPFQGIDRYYHCFRSKELENLAVKSYFGSVKVGYLERNGKPFNLLLRAKKN